MQHGKPLLAVSPRAVKCQSDPRGFRGKAINRVLVRVFRADCLSFDEVKRLIANRDDLITLTHQMHLDPTLLFVVESDVVKLIEIEISIKIAVDAPEQV